MIEPLLTTLPPRQLDLCLHPCSGRRQSPACIQLRFIAHSYD